MKNKSDIVKILRGEEAKGKLKAPILKSGKTSKSTSYNEITKKDTILKYSIDAKRTLQTLVNLISDPVVIVDKKGTFLEISDGVEELTGVKREQLLGTNFMKAKFITAKSKAILIKNLARRMLGDKLEKYEVEAINKDGEKLILEVSGIKINYNDKPADLVIMHDISIQKKTEEALKASENKW